MALLLATLCVLLGLALYVVWTAWPFLSLFALGSSGSFRSLPGPESPSWLWGNSKEIDEAEPGVAHERWIQQFGPTFRYRTFLNRDRLFTMDLRAINHILSRSEDYHKSKLLQLLAAAFGVGEGVLTTEGERHRRQRRIMNPAFGPAQIRDLTEIFLDKSVQLRDILYGKISEGDGVVRLDMLSWLSRLTLDVIGLAGYGHDFQGLVDGPKHELSEAFASIFNSGKRFSKTNVMALSQALFPPLRFIRTERLQQIQLGQKDLQRLSRKLFEEKKAAFSESLEKGGQEMGRDLLSLLVKANMAESPEHRLTDEDVLAEIPTMLIAGHETTGTTATFALFAMCRAPEIQVKLRSELASIPTDMPSMEQLQSLPYLDMVVRETLRLYPAVSWRTRIATKHDILPMTQPVVDTHGNVHQGLKVAPGDSIYISIVALSRSEYLWGKDAGQFRPERWPSLPETVETMPGVWGNTLAFWGGTHSCIGYRFSITELKAILFTLVRAFHFELAVDAKDVLLKSSIVTRPMIAGEEYKGNQLPFFIRPVSSI